MEYLIGILLALASLLLSRSSDSTVIVIASYYGLFAVMGVSIQALAAESVAMTIFLGAAILGFTRNLWLVVGALLAQAFLIFSMLISLPTPASPPSGPYSVWPTTLRRRTIWRGC